jgi:hypothetical protein
MGKNKKGNPDKVHPYLARKALEMAGGDKNAAYSYCVELSWKLCGRLAPGFDNADLQAFYEKEEIQISKEEEKK